MKNVADIYPLSPMQELMLLNATPGAGSDVLINQAVYRIPQALDIQRFEQAWNTVVARHTALRTIFLWENLDEPVQVVRETVKVVVHHEDWRHLPPNQVEAQLDAFAAAELDRSRSLKKAPLMRLALLQTGDAAYYFVWSSHHLIMDRWSTPLIMNEVQALYAADTVPTQPERAPAYRAYIAWLQKQDADEANWFWRQELAGIEQSTPLLPAQPTSATPSYHELRASIGADTTARLQRFATDNRITLGTVVFGAWALLHMPSNPARDLLLGTTVAGRPPDLAHVESMIGSFINNLPVRVPWTPDTPLTTWLQTLQRKQLNIQGVDFVSPVQLQSLSELDTRITETLFLYQSSIASNNAGFHLELVDAPPRTNFPITLFSIAGEDAALDFSLVFDETRFELAVVESVLGELCALLDQLPDQGEQRLEDVATPLVERYAHLREQPSAVAMKPEAPAEAQVVTSDATADERELLRIWQGLLGHADIGLDDDFFDLGGTSLQVIQMMSQLRHRYHTDMKASTILRMRTIRQLAAFISTGPTERTPDEFQASTGAEAERSRWHIDASATSTLVEINRGDTQRPPIIFVHNNHGHVLNYRDVARHIGEDQPFYGIQADVAETSPHFGVSVEEMAERYLKDILVAQPEGPYLIGGFCGSGLIAYEMGRRLIESGHEVALLALLFTGNIAGALPADSPEGGLRGTKRRGGKHRLNSVRRSIYRPLYRLYKSALMLLIRIRVYLNMPLTPAMHDHLDQLRFKNFGRLCRRYIPPTYPGDIALLRLAKQGADAEKDPTYGWRGVVQGEIDVCYLPTDRTNILEERAEPVADELRKRIDRVAGPAPNADAQAAAPVHR